MAGAGPGGSGGDIINYNYVRIYHFYLFLISLQAGTWQQLAILKRRALEERERPATTEGLTRSERLLWFRENQPEVELDK